MNRHLFFLFFVFCLCYSFPSFATHDGCSQTTCTPAPGFECESGSCPEGTASHMCSYHNTNGDYTITKKSYKGGGLSRGGCRYIITTIPGTQDPEYFSPCSDYAIVSTNQPGTANDAVFEACERNPFGCPAGESYDHAYGGCCPDGTVCISPDQACLSVEHSNPTNSYTSYFSITRDTSINRFKNCLFQINSQLETELVPEDGSVAPCYTFTFNNLGKQWSSEDGPTINIGTKCVLSDMCPDGFPRNIEPWLNCDRPDLQQCGENVILASEICLEGGSGEPLDTTLGDILEAINRNRVELGVAAQGAGIGVENKLENKFNDNISAIQQSATDIKGSVNLNAQTAREGHIALEKALNNNTTAVAALDSNNQTSMNSIVNAINANGTNGRTTSMGAHTIGEYDTVSAVNTAFYSSIGSSPLVSSFSAVGDVVSSGGSCSSFDIDLTGLGWGNISTSIHCDIAETIRGPLSALMLIMYTILAFRIFASA